MEKRQKIADLINRRLYLILDLGLLPENICPSFMAEQLVQNGVDMIQLRAKGKSEETILNKLENLAPIALRYKTPIIVNDYVQITLKLRDIMADFIDDFDDVENPDGLWGIHLGQDDEDCAKAREILGDGAIIGISTHDIKQAQKAEKDGADYIGYGCMFPTSTKGDIIPGNTAIAENIRKKVDLPLYLIGGINFDNIDILIKSGFDHFAIAGGILRMKNPAEWSKKIANKLIDSRHVEKW